MISLFFSRSLSLRFFFFFFFNDTATTEIYTLSLHDALPIYVNSISSVLANHVYNSLLTGRPYFLQLIEEDRKSTRLNSSHLVISYAVFCLKKKKTTDFSSRIVLWYSRSTYYIPTHSSHALTA